MADFQDLKVRAPRKYGAISADKFSYILAEGTPNTRPTAQGSNAALAEVSTFGILGCLFILAGATVRCLFTLPEGMRRSAPLYLRVVYATAGTTAADTITWKVFYEKFLEGVAISATVNDALDTVIAEDTTGTTTAYAVLKSPWGVINANKFDDNTTTIILEVELDATAIDIAGSELTYMLALEYSYEAQKEVNVGTDDALDAPA